MCTKVVHIWNDLSLYIYIHYAKHIRFGETPLKNKNHVINIILYAKNIFGSKIPNLHADRSFEDVLWC